MSNLLRKTVLLLAACLPLVANQRFQGDCMQGSYPAVTSGISSTTLLMRSFPRCTVSVFLTGTSTVATLFADNSTTPLENPFASDRFGHWFFYAANGRYDVTLSGASIPAPFTLGDVLLQDAGAITTADWLTILNPPLIDVRRYNFTAQTPGGSLAVGNNTITVAPVPLGVNGTDTNHWLYVSGGTGTVEGCLINGGTAVAGNTTGTLILACLNTHTGAWTIQSATGGIREAFIANSTGGMFLLPVGTIQLFSFLLTPSNTWLLGQGQGISTLKLANSMWPASASGPFYFVNSASSAPAALASADGASNVRLSGFTLDMNGANNPNATFGNSIYMVNCVDCWTDHVTVKNARHGGAAIWSIGPTTKNNIHFKDVISGYGTAPCTGGIGVQDGQILSSRTSGTCDSNFICNNDQGPSYARCIVADSVGVNGTSASTSANFIDESHPNSKFISNTATGPANSGCFYITATAVPANVGSVQLVANECGANAAGAPVFGILTNATGTFTIASLEAIGNNVVGTSNNCIDFGGNSGTPAVLNASVKGGYLKSCGNVGIFVEQGATNLGITGVNISSVVANGIQVNATGTSGIYIAGNIIKSSGGTSIVDGSNAANIQPNVTDDAWNNITSLSPIVTAQVSVVNGLNSNVSTLIGATNPSQILLDPIGPTGAWSLGGLANPIPGKRVIIPNYTGFTFTVKNEDAGSTATNRITIPGGADLTPVLEVTLVYTATRNRWAVESWH